MGCMLCTLFRMYYACGMLCGVAHIMGCMLLTPQCTGEIKLKHILAAFIAMCSTQTSGA